MKNLIITILTAACLVLGVAILVQHGKAIKQLDTAKSENTRLSGELTGLRSKADDQDKVITRLETDLSKSKEELTAKSQELTAKGQELERKVAELAAARTNYALAQAELQKQTTRITELEAQRTGLNEKLENLQGSITSLETRIADTKKKLAAAEGDRQELLTQLKKLETEKSQLVAQFNNISVLRTQLAKLKEEAAIAQRLAWIRTGVYSNQEKKGAQRLFAEVEKKEGTGNRLDVEVEQNGAARVVPPKSSAPVN